MSTALVEGVQSGDGQLWIGRQVAAGTMLASGSANQIAVKLLESSLKAHKAYDKAEYADGERYSNSQIFTNEIGGEIGEFKILGQPDIAGRIFAQFFNVDVVTGAGPDYVHTITSAGGGGLYNTIHQSVGTGSNSVKQIFWDALLDMLQWECSAENPAASLNAKVLARVAGQLYTTDPTATIDTQESAVWPNIEGSITIGGTVFESVQGESLEIDNGSELERGDSPDVVAFVNKRGQITRSLSTFLNDETLPLYYSTIYNDSTPSAGDTPVSDVVSATAVTRYTVGANRYIEFDTPNLTFEPGEFPAVSPNPEGGTIDLTLSGSCRKSGSTAALTVEVGSGLSAAFV